MGQLFYGPTEQAIEVDDALLAHVQVVAFTKLRRNESFVMSWQRSEGPGRETVWVQPSIPLRFVCESEIPMDGRLLEELAQAAASLRGMDLSPNVAPALTAMEGGARRAA
ncbi:DUF7882 family protein [Microbacterium sp. JZ31]|uniref:DUF7882 family protein n=1 Tax=Microbacterium sp. JZ31 TaxID=1906274 RepID=UPI00193461B1|nr:hypothetical protein [Microbacterium sp. JZ31]